jgi:hypothetical protein
MYLAVSVYFTHIKHVLEYVLRSAQNCELTCLLLVLLCVHLAGAFSEAPIDSNETDTQIAQLYTYAFSLDYRALSASDNVTTDFKSQLQKAFLAGVAGAWTDGPSLADANGALKLAYVLVSNFRPGSVVGNARSSGSVVADVYFTPPKGTTQQQLRQLASKAPGEFISSSSKLQEHLLGAEFLGQSAAGAGRSRRPLGPGGIAGIVTGVVLSAVAGLALALLLVRWRARRSAASAGIIISSSLPAAAGGRGGSSLRRISPLQWGRSGPIFNTDALPRPPTAAAAGGRPVGESVSNGSSAPGNDPLVTGSSTQSWQSEVPERVLHYNFMFYCVESQGGSAASSATHSGEGRSQQQQLRQLDGSGCGTQMTGVSIAAAAAAAAAGGLSSAGSSSDAGWLGVRRVEGAGTRRGSQSGSDRSSSRGGQRFSGRGADGRPIWLP